MTRQLVAVICVLCLATPALGQTGMNFGSRTGGLGNAGGFSTGSGFSNNSMGSPNFSANAGRAFSNSGGFPNGSNAVYSSPSGYVGSYGGPAGYTGYPTTMSGAVNPAFPSSAFGVGVDALGTGVDTNGLGLGNAAMYGVPGMDISAMALGSAGFSYGLPALGLPGVASPVPGVGGVPLPDATSGGMTARSRRTENRANGFAPERALPVPEGVPVVTENGLRIQERISRSGSSEQFRNVKVLMAGRTAVLRGSVESQNDDRVVQRLISLEPTVQYVVSQLDYPGKGQSVRTSAAR